MQLAIEQTEFKFDELPADIQQDAINNFRNSDNYLWYDWYDGVYEQYVEDMQQNGYDDIKINFSGFWSQGDGASFTADVDVEYFIDKWNNDYSFLKWVIGNSNICEIFCKIVRRNHHYSHENTCSIDWDYELHWDWIDEELSEFKVAILKSFGGEDYIHEKIQSLMDAIEEDRKDWCKKIYRALENEYEFLISDEVIKDHIECNDFRFDEDGNLL